MPRGRHYHEAKHDQPLPLLSQDHEGTMRCCFMYWCPQPLQMTTADAYTCYYGSHE